MRWKTSILAISLIIAGCAEGSLVDRQDENVISSLQFDKVPCKQLLARRNGLSQRFNLPKDAKPTFTEVPTGTGPLLPDIRPQRQRDAEKAAGEIDAMNRSLIRRQCIPEPKPA